MRTRNASIAMPTARPSAITLMTGAPSGTNAAKTKNMMSAAAVTTRAAPLKPCVIACRGGAPCTYASRMPDTRNTS